MNYKKMRLLLEKSTKALKEVELLVIDAKQAMLPGAFELLSDLKLYEIAQHQFWINQLKLETYKQRNWHACQVPLRMNFSGNAFRKFARYAHDDIEVTSHAEPSRRRILSEGDANPVPYTLHRLRSLMGDNTAT